MKKIQNFPILLMLVVVFSLSSCASNSGGPKFTKAVGGAAIGAGSGAIAGQAIGRSTEATLIGAGIGLVLGYIIGNEWDKSDNKALGQAYEMNRDGQTTTWKNPNSGITYSAQPSQPYARSAAQPICRDAQISATIDGKSEVTHTTACRNVQGQWVLQS